MSYVCHLISKFFSRELKCTFWCTNFKIHVDFYYFSKYSEIFIEKHFFVSKSYSKFWFRQVFARSTSRGILSRVPLSFVGVVRAVRHDLFTSKKYFSLFQPRPRLLSRIFTWFHPISVASKIATIAQAISEVYFDIQLFSDWFLSLCRSHCSTFFKNKFISSMQLFKKISTPIFRSFLHFFGTASCLKNV